MKRFCFALLLFLPFEISLAHEPSFTEDIAPLIITHCAECHNSSDLSGDIDLTDPESAATAFVPGQPEESELWLQVESDAMPHKRTPLTADEKALLKKWIEHGAKWDGGKVDPFAFTTANRAGYDWWSLQPIKPVEVPELTDDSWSRNEVDPFILAELRENGLQPSEEADRRTLIRRLFFDLTGLPPTPEEVDAFVGDPRSDAYEKWVDRLLESPHYGERWARHWLDVIRFGESQGFERNRVRENAWRFRDWVVRALNEDMPYDEFVREQIAGDVIHPNRLDSLIATGYHVSGTWDQVGHKEGSEAMQRVARQDHLEDLVSTLGQAYMGLTIHCARCHDHKFDPITQKEYYQFTAFLAGLHQEEREQSGVQLWSEFDEEIAGEERRLAEMESELRERYAEGERSGIEGLIAAWEFSDEDPNRFGPKIEKSGDNWSTEGPAKELSDKLIATAEISLEAWVTTADLTQQGPARVVTISKDGSERNLTLGQEGGRWVVRLRTTTTSPNGLEPLEGGAVEKQRTHLVYTFNAEGLARLYVNGAKVAEKTVGGDLSNWDASYRLGFGDEFGGGRPWKGEIHRVAIYQRALSEREIREHASDPGIPLIPGEHLEDAMVRWSDEDRNRWHDLTNSIATLKAQHPHPEFTGTAHIPKIETVPPVHVLARGNVTQPLDQVTPKGLAALKGLSADMGLAEDSPEGERRRRLSEWLTHEQHPLASRVMVNRVWHYHFGRGIVATPSDFGFSGALPTHPELLDYLSHRFIEGGWQLKGLHRLIVTSAAYRQASNVSNDKAEAIDQDGGLLWRYSAKRLEGEAIRDAMLAISGELNPAIGGPSFRDVEVESGMNDTFGNPLEIFDASTNRRTLYRLWARSGTHPLLEALDCPEPSVMAPQRMRTITPIQALSLLNGSFAGHCAQHLSERVIEEMGYDAAGQIDRLFSLVLLRSPEPGELKNSIHFISEHGLDQLALVLFNSNEFLFVE